jgi:hypothetical protein
LWFFFKHSNLEKDNFFNSHFHLDFQNIFLTWSKVRPVYTVHISKISCLIF